MNWSNWVALVLLADIAPIPPVPPELPEHPIPLPTPEDPVFGFQLPEPTPIAIAGLALCLAVFLTVRLLARRRRPHFATALALGAAAPVLLATVLLVAWAHRTWDAWQATVDEQTASFQAQAAEYKRQSEFHAEAVRAYEIELRSGRGSPKNPDEFLMDTDDFAAVEATFPEAAPAIAPDSDPE